MVNGLGVLGWGVGGIEAEAAMLGQPVSMLVPQVVGFRLTGKLKEGTTATDLVLTVTEALRKLGVVGKFVEFYGPGIAELPLADRATIANMAPEYGATCGIFPVDAETLQLPRASPAAAEEHIALVEAYFREQGLFHTADAPEAEYSATLSLDLATVEPCVAGPKRPQDRVLLSGRRRQLRAAAARAARPQRATRTPPARSAAGRAKAATPTPTATSPRPATAAPLAGGDQVAVATLPDQDDSLAVAPTSIAGPLRPRSRALPRPRHHRHRRHHQLHQHLATPTS